VTWRPRLSAYLTWNGPISPVPPRIKIRVGFTDRPDVVNRSLEVSIAAEANESDRKPSAPLAKAESFRNVLRSVGIRWCDVFHRRHGPNLCRYSPDEINALTISAPM